MARLRYNGLTATLGAALTTSATSVTFGAALTHANGVAVPTIASPDYIPLSILDSSGNFSEIVYLTSYTSGSTTGTITRAAEGAGTAVAHNSGDKVIHGPTALDLAGDTTWTAPTFQNSWSNYGGSGLNAGFRKDGSGVVHLRGIIKGGAVGSVAFTLPAGYRPPGQATYAVVCANTAGTASVFGSVNVNADGTVLINGGTAWTYLDGITFYTD